MTSTDFQNRRRIRRPQPQASVRKCAATVRRTLWLAAWTTSMRRRPMRDRRATIKAVRADGHQRDCRCPGHDDRRESLSVGLGADGRVLLKCHAGCGFKAVLGAAKMKPSDLFERRNGQG